MKRAGRTAAAATALVAAAACLLCGPGRPAVALGAADGTPPSGSVGGVRSPASGTLELRINASDTGSGLAGAEATLDGAAPVYVRLGSGSCPEHPAPGSEPPPGAECPEAVSGAALAVDTRGVSDGEWGLRVQVTDGAGNTATLVDEAIVVRNAPHSSGTSDSVTVGVGNGSSGSPGGSEGAGGSAGAATSAGRGPSLGLRAGAACRSPRLKMHLARKPLWRTHPHRVPVLRYRRLYPFRGRLTCLVSGRRVPAPNGTPVKVFYRVWELTFKRPRGPVLKLRKGSIRVHEGGRLAVRLGFRTGRTVIFRYRRDTALAKAKVRVAVAPRGRLLPRWLR